MKQLSLILQNAVADQDVPFVVGMVANRDQVLWQGAVGQANVNQVADVQTIFRIFSMTKAVGGFATMMMVERGKMTLDTPVKQILPEFEKIKVFEGFNDRGPVLRAPKRDVTIRHLATHTSGFVYELWNAKMTEYMEKTGALGIFSGKKSALFSPLMFDPGERWDYGIGIDWLGQCVEAIAGKRMDQFCQEEIFAPLSMHDSSLEPDPAKAKRLATLKTRGEDGNFIDFRLAPPANPEFYGMGHAIYSTPHDYMRFLRMVLRGGELDGKRLVKHETIHTMLANHTGDLLIPKLATVNPFVAADVELFPGKRKSHGIAFMRFDEATDGMRSANSHGWAGLLNTHCWLDPDKDRACLIMTQALPFVDPRFLKTYEAFERRVYQA